MNLSKPTQADLAAAYGQTLPDIIAPNLNVLFCGINPSLYSVAIGHHFGRPGNRFWKSLHAAGFTDRLLSPREDGDLLSFGYGLTNVADRATARADQLEIQDFQQGRTTLTAKVKRYQPRCLAILGITAYRAAFQQPKAVMGRQPLTISNTMIWVLPNPSGLNAHYQLDDLQRVYGELRSALLEGEARGVRSEA